MKIKTLFLIFLLVLLPQNIIYAGDGARERAAASNKAESNGRSDKPDLTKFFEMEPLKFGVDNSGKNIAKVFCDNEHLKLSAYNDSRYLYVQAAIYGDGISEGIRAISQGRKIADYSQISFDMDADGRRTPQKDREFSVNPLVSMEGLYYDVVVSDRATTSLKKAADGDGKIIYRPVGGDKVVRFDRYAIALSDLFVDGGGQTIKFCFYAYSENPMFEINSAGYNRFGKDFLNTSGTKKYYGYGVPLKLYHSYEFCNESLSKHQLSAQ